jgi:chromosome segregation ATPase
VADLPNFDALRAYLAQTPGQANLSELLTPVGSWIDKLEEWSKDRLRDLEDARDERFDADQKRMETEADLEDAADAYRSLVETLHDFERGIRDWQEVQDLLPDPLGTFTKGNPWQGS